MAAEPAVPQPGECRRIFETIEHAARSLGVRDVEVVVGGQAAALTRFSNNAIHQNVFERGRAVSVRVLLDQRTGRATTNRLGADALQRVVEEAVALTKASAPDPGLLPLAAPEPVAESDRFDSTIASSTPEHRAEAVAEAIRIVESASQTAAGIFSTEHGGEALFNTAGVAVYQAETLARFSITAMAGDSSGWAKASTTRLDSMDVRALATSARDKARLSASPREIEPGRYTVLLEPAAVLDLVGQMFGDFSGTAIEDQRSFLCDRLGEPLFGENINIIDDVRHPLQAGPTYDGEGVPRQKLRLVEKGVPIEVAWSRAAAQRAGRAPTGLLCRFLFEG